MNILINIVKDFGKFFNFKTRTGLIRTIIVAVLAVALIVFWESRSEELVAPTSSLRTVTVGTVTSLSSNDGISLIGTVASKNQAEIQSEAAGRVTRVNASLGQALRAGAIIAELENASQYAALLQAQGAYEAAQAAALQSNVSVDDAKNALLKQQNSVVSTYQNAYTTTNDVLLNTIDQFYSNPTETIVGVKITTDVQPATLIAARKELNTLMSAWQAQSLTATNASDLRSLIAQARSATADVLVISDTLLNAVTNADQQDTLDGTPLTSYSAALLSARANLNGVINNLNTAESNLTAAEDAVRKAEIGGQNPEVSAANAQLKQALGTLKAAEAAYQKTIIRTPIAGTLNELKIKTGDFVSQFTPVALVANNNALEVTTYVGELDAALVSVGNEVTIDDATLGVITAIAPGIDTVTRKTEVKIGAESDTIQNGDTVTITLTPQPQAPAVTTQPILVPIEAVKFTATAGSIFTVTTDGVLEAHAVELGPVVGSYVTVTKGIDRETVFVLDARGLAAGETVEAVTK